jgi:hypothetical protein
MQKLCSSEKRRYRPFYIVCLPLLFLVCIVAATIVAITTHEPLRTAPLIIAAFGLIGLMRWTMIWLSLPEERKLFGRVMDHEWFSSLARDLTQRNARREKFQTTDAKGDENARMS